MACTPGCLTQTLWKPHLELVEEKAETQDVDLSRAPDGTPGLVLEGRDGERSWWLRPARGTEVALRLLADPEMMREMQASVTAVRDHVEGASEHEVLHADAKLELSTKVTAATFGEVVDIASVSAAARRVLVEPRTNAFAYAADPWLYLPSVMRDCMERLSSPVLATAFADAGEPLRIESFVFVGADGQPCFEPGMEVPREATDPELPFDQRCELLRSYALLVRTTRGGRQQIVRLRPDRVWLWTACECTRGVVRHVSHWQWQQAPTAIEAPIDAPVLACRFSHSTRLFRRVVWDRSAWFKVLLTPFAVAGDVVLALPVVAAEALIAVLIEELAEELQPPRLGR